MPPGIGSFCEIEFVCRGDGVIKSIGNRSPMMVRSIYVDIHEDQRGLEELLFVWAERSCGYDRVLEVSVPRGSTLSTLR